MDPLLFDALKAGKKIVHLVTVVLPAATIRWTDGGFVKWGDDFYRAKDATYGVLDSIGEIVDGVDDDASPVEIGIIPPSLESLDDLIAADAQGGVVTIHIGAVDETTGLLIGEPYRLHRGRLDRPVVNMGAMTLTYEILTAEALGLEPNEDQRQSDAFHQSIWPGERGYEHQTEGSKKVYWRDDDPNNAIGYISPRRRKGGDPKEFNYEADAALPFPFGRVQVGAALNYRVGFGPTNRYNAIIGTVAASGPIRSWAMVHVDDEVTTFGANDVATNGEHAGALWMQRKLGTQPQAALTFPTGLDYGGQPPQGWDEDYGQSGRAVFLATMFENSKKSEYAGGVPTIKNTLEGLFGWDPRDEDSLLSDPSTWPYIEYGPIADLNWCIGRWEGASGGGDYGVPYACSIVGGLGADLEDIDVNAFIYAANVAEANGWKVSYVATSALDKQEVRKTLLQSAGAVPSRRGGLISCISHGAPRDSVMDVTNADTAGSFDVEFWASRLDRRNTVIPKFTSESHLWELTAIAPVTNPDWLIQDGGKRSDGATYEGVPAEDQCAQLAYLDMANDRELKSETPFKPHMLALEPGQNFTWREPRFLLDGVKAQARVRKYDPMEKVVRLEWRQETDSKYVEAGVQTGIAPPPTGDYVPPDLPGDPAEIPITRSVTYPTSATEDTISVVTFDAILASGDIVTIPAGTITGLDELTMYGVFWKDGAGFEAEPQPAPNHMTAGSWIFIAWQATADAEGGYPEQPDPPGGYCPQEDEQLLLANEDHTGPGETIRAGDAVPGETWVWTRHEHTGAWGAFLVTGAVRRESDLVSLIMRDGRSPKFSPLHRMGLANGRFRRLTDLCCGNALDGTGPGTVDRTEPAGQGWVVRLSVDDAATYVIDGLLCHNVKPIDGG